MKNKISASFFLTIFILLSLSAEARQTDDSSGTEILERLNDQFVSLFKPLAYGKTYRLKDIRKDFIKKSDPVADKLIAFLTLNNKPNLKKYKFFPYGVAEKEGKSIYYLFKVSKEDPKGAIDLVSYEEASIQGKRLFVFACKEFKWKEEMLTIGSKDQLNVTATHFHKYTKKDKEGTKTEIKSMGKAKQEYLISYAMTKRMLKNKKEQQN